MYTKIVASMWETASLTFREEPTKNISRIINERISPSNYSTERKKTEYKLNMSQCTLTFGTESKRE